MMRASIAGDDTTFDHVIRVVTSSITAWSSPISLRALNRFSARSRADFFIPVSLSVDADADSVTWSCDSMNLHSLMVTRFLNGYPLAEALCSAKFFGDAHGVTV